MNTNRITSLFASSAYNRKRDVYRAVLTAACECADANATHYGVPVTDRATSFSIGDMVKRMWAGYELHDVFNAVIGLRKENYLDSDDLLEFQFLRISDVTAELVGDGGEVLAA